MSFTSGSIAFKRFTINGAFPSEVTEPLIDRLSQNAFKTNGPITPDGTTVGWITPEHLFDTQFTIEKVAVGRFLLFALRRDRTNAPANIVKSYIRLEEKASLACTHTQESS